MIAVITGKYSFIRGTEHDDVPALAALYGPGVLRAGLLDSRREPIMPTAGELGELLGRKEIADGAFYTVEDRGGRIRGFCSLRGLNPEARHCEFSLLLLEEPAYEEPLASEAAEFLLDRAFRRYGLRKVVAYCLPSEKALAGLLASRGFQSAGIQREVLYAGGRWHDLETFTRTNEEPVPAPAGMTSDAL